MRTATLLVAVGCCIVLCGCQQHTAGFRSASASPDAVLLELPRLSQKEADRCGVVSVAILCGYHNATLPEDQFLRLGDLAARHGGLSGAEVRDALRAAGLGTALFAGTRADLRAHIDAGRPVLAMISLDGKRHHYCLVNGYEPGGDVLYIVEPRRGPVAVSADRFDALWERSRRFALVAAPDIAAPDVVARAAPTSELAVAQPLEELRAGDINLSDRELTIIGITALAVLILVLIL